MLRRISIIVFAIGLLLPQSVEAQKWRTRRYESYIGLGTANHFGDIGGSLSAENLYGFKDIQIKFTRPSMAMGMKYRIDRRFVARANLGFAYMVGNDVGAKNEVTRINGGYAFKTFIFEPSAIMEYYIIPEPTYTNSNALYRRSGLINSFADIRLYVFAGVGGVMNFPKISYVNGGDYVDDGFGAEGAEFKRMGLAFPFGAGIKYDLSSIYTIGAEMGRRYTLTDYVDGYSSRYSTSNDVYDFITFSLSYKIKTDRRGLPVFFEGRNGLHRR